MSIDRRTLLAALATGWASGAQANAATGMDKLRARGSLRVGIYQDMPPFHVKGRGIDVDLAQALAQALGLRLELLPFHADENMNDDLRNMVWKGHYLGYGPADVLMHVPVDKPLMDATPQALIFAPYYRERIVLARRLARLPRLEQLSQLGGETVAVPGQSLAGWLLLGADGGAYQNQLNTHWKNGAECAQALLRGEFAAAAGLASELESVLRGQAGFAIEPLPLPRAPRQGWATGLAVKKDAVELAQALQYAVNTLAADGGLGRIFETHHLSWQTP
ncbi:ABC-type amino acid transport substrate-binding protein [Paucibacter oligotrophus]|uniref:ABC-type amino acid transport substrate-binding protein n=1 Tax=Roseateles oligotrophus TaxID=1769250 RepID=A0A840L1R9_9BURK|nr:transporter substrate-binding domain-containing protein [Roseateles oligotrophus]MBB4841761.1 ABC-type amino acid transport substrate-binding protein [Roseateles oligotrophus]